MEPESTAGFPLRALVEMKEIEKILIGEEKNDPPADRKLYVSLDRAGNVIEGGPLNCSSSLS